METIHSDGRAFLIDLDRLVQIERFEWIPNNRILQYGSSKTSSRVRIVVLAEENEKNRNKGHVDVLL